MGDSIYERISSLGDHLDDVKDPVLLVLKGHLVVEAALRDMVGSMVSTPSYLQKANLSFYQLLNVARAMLSDTDVGQPSDLNEKVWDAIEALNQLRNQLAHRLEPTNIKPLLGRIVLMTSYNQEELTDPRMIGYLNHAIGYISGMLAAQLVMRNMIGGLVKPPIQT